MTQYLRALIDTEQQEGGPIRFIASTEGTKRDGKDLSSTDWLTENYLRNPVVLWVHDYWGQRLPVGRTTNLSADTDARRLIADIQFDQEDEFARAIESKYRRGFLNAVSVGWDETREGNELLDISAVPVPGDPDALMERQKRALSDIGKELLEVLEPDERITPVESGAIIWRGVATAMGDLLQTAPDELPEEERRKIYNDLERLYRRLGKTPPEYMTAEGLALLGDDDLRGLLLEDEPFEGRAVRFAQRALDNLSQAAELIRGVVDGVHAPQNGVTVEEDNIDVLQRISSALNKIGG